MKKGSSFVRLMGFEGRKNFFTPWILLLTVALLLANGWRLSSEYQNKIRYFSEYEAVYEDFYQRWKGSITTETVQELMTIFSPLEEKAQTMSLNRSEGSGTYTKSEGMDYDFFLRLFREEMEYDYLYGNRAIGIAQDAGKLASYFRGLGLTERAAESEAYAGTFSHRSVPNFADTRHIEVWLKHDYSSLLVLLLSLFGLCGVFVTEWETEMYMLQRVSRLGGGTNAAAKLTASLLYVCGLCLLFYGEDFLVLQALSGHWEALKSPLYAVWWMEDTPLNMTMGAYVLWSMAVKTLGMLSCGCLILLASCLCRRVLTAFVTSLGSLMVLIVVQEGAQGRMSLKWFNPMELVLVRENVTDTGFVSIFGCPVHRYVVILLGILLVTAAMAGGILLRHPGRRERRRRA